MMIIKCAIPMFEHESVYSSALETSSSSSSLFSSSFVDTPNTFNGFLWIHSLDRDGTIKHCIQLDECSDVKKIYQRLRRDRNGVNQMSYHSCMARCVNAFRDFFNWNSLGQVKISVHAILKYFQNINQTKFILR